MKTNHLPSTDTPQSTPSPAKRWGLPRGLRLNNPGNIRHGGSQWKGASVDQPDKSFVKFNTLTHGYRALWILLNNYYHVHHLYTLRDIITRYAPPKENNTEGYIKTLSPALPLYGEGDGSMVILPQPRGNFELWAGIITRITMVEQGIPEAQVDQSAIAQGYHLAFASSQ